MARTTSEGDGRLTPTEKRYEKIVEGVDQIAVETAFTNDLQSMLDHGNKHILKNFKLRLVMEPEKL